MEAIDTVPLTGGDPLRGGDPAGPTENRAEPRCDGCGAPIDAVADRCAYCGSGRVVVRGIEDEAKALFAVLATRLEEIVTQRTDVALIAVFFAFLASGPLCYFALAEWTGIGLFGRIILSLLAALFIFFIFGWQCNAREGAAEHAAWRDAIAPEIHRFADYHELELSRLARLAETLLAEDSRLKRVFFKWMAR